MDHPPAQKRAKKAKICNLFPQTPCLIHSIIHSESTVNPHNPQLFILLVHYGETHTTRRALTSLTRGTVQPTRVLVVDHGQPELTGVSETNVTVVRPSSGGGYAAGINFGLGTLISLGAQADDIVVAMNNDVEVYPDTLAHLRTWWSTAASPGLVGVSVHERGQTVLGGGRINYWTGRANLIIRQHGGPADMAGRLGYIHGAFVAAPYHVWLGLQGLPGHYHLYWEDVLLGQRASQRGISLHFAPTVRLKHHTVKKITSHQAYYLIRNGALFMQQESRRPWRWWWLVYNRLRYLYHALHPAPSHRLPARALKDALMGKTGKVNSI